MAFAHGGVVWCGTGDRYLLRALSRWDYGNTLHTHTAALARATRTKRRRRPHRERHWVIPAALPIPTDDNSRLLG